jgi:uncharacterized protein (TIGR02391 family)
VATFGELLAKVPKAKRSSRVRVIAALHCAVATPGGTATTTEVREVLRLHLRGAAPGNVADILAKAAPYVEVVERRKGQHSWRLTDSGTGFLQDLVGPEGAGNIKMQALSFDDLHPDIQRAAEGLFQGKHYSEAVGRAAKALNLMVRQKTGRTRDEGVRMMHQVFEKDQTGAVRLQVNDLKEDWQRDEQDGVRSMMAGVQAAVANVDKHGDLGLNDPVHALELLASISFLARIVDRCRRVNP